MSPTRRAVLRAAGAAAATALVGACAPSTRRVQVVVVWSGRELDLFREVLGGYPRPVEVISGGDNIDALLRARHSAGTGPDVAVLSRPGLIAEYAQAGWLEPLDPTLADVFPPLWRHLLQVDGALYGVWVKAAHKSLMWRLPDVVPQPPQDWPHLVTMVRELADRNARGAAGPAPLAIGAADGWVLTDWLENRLATLLTRELYNALGAGQPRWDATPVRRAFTELAELWSVPGAFPGGGRRAQLTQLEDSVLQVVATRQAAMVYEGDFVAAVVKRFEPMAGPAEPFRFPGAPPGTTRPLVVGGDAAVVFKGSREGLNLVRWLVDSQSFRPWINDGGYLSANRAVPQSYYPTPLTRSLVGQLTDPAEDVRFDLSDLLPGALTGADGQGSWQILQDFFAEVTTGADNEAAVSRTIDRLMRATRAIQAAGR